MSPISFPKPDERDLIREYLLIREIYGVLLTITSRPQSKTNDGVMVEALSWLDDLFDRLSRLDSWAILSPDNFTILKTLLSLRGSVDLQLAAKTSISGVRYCLNSIPQRATGFLRHYQAQPSFAGDYTGLIISVGPTIGVGDEILVAHAVVSRAQELNLKLYIESQRFPLWQTFSAACQDLGKPPLSAAAFWDGLETADRRRTGHIYADFLSIDPNDFPLEIYPGCAFSARWVFGNASGLFFDWHRSNLYVVNYPQGMPQCRLLENLWIVSRLIPASGIYPACFPARQNCAPELTFHPDKSATPLNLLLQVLTAKDCLIMPPSFYLETLAAAQRLADRKLCISVIAAPTEQARDYCRNVTEVLSSHGNFEKVTLLEVMSLSKVLEFLQQSDVLFGPDTFTGHFAALRGVRQVTIGLQEHHSWINPWVPGLFITANQGASKLVDRSIRRLSFMLDCFDLKKYQPLRSIASAWQSALGNLNELAQLGIQENGGFDLDKAEDLIATIVELKDNALKTGVNPRYLLNREDYARFQKLSLRRYDTPVDALMATIRWSHDLGTTSLSGVLCSL